MANNLFAANNGQATGNVQARGNYEPAVGFVNLYLPSRNGGRTKLGAIPLKASRDHEMALFEALKDADKVEDVKKAILARIELDFQVVETGDGKHFDLGF